MKKVIISLTAILLLTADFLFGQNAHFTTSGVIEYEKTVNMYALIRKEITKDNESYMQPAYEAYKKSSPQFRKFKSTLSFSNNRTLFKPVEEENTANGGFFGNSPAATQNNVIYSDLNTGTGIAQKKVFEGLFLISDSTRKIKWKITDETREIAGYTCRRANAIMLDSIYVVAFYTTSIPVPGGPESFSGLPGMILGVALPHESMTWFAIKVTDMALAPAVIVPPKKGKPMDNKGFEAVLRAAFKDWGTEANFYAKAFSL